MSNLYDDESTVSNIVSMDCSDVLSNNYLPYALGTITDRAIPDIDGLKPVHRKILYVMYKMGLLKGSKTKSANIVGQTMQYHPHGDMAIYQTMVRMAQGNGSLLIPYIDSKGNFGKTYSRDMAFAASRYTEAKLAEVAKELFDGIDENAVDFIPNYDGKKKEPVILPAKFPNILVNTAPGIAVGMSSSIPSYNLREVCEATKRVIDGLDSIEELATILQAPDFPTGGIVHNNGNDFMNVLKGRGSVQISGTVVITGLRATIKEIPFDTSIEAIIEKVEELQKNELKEVKDIKNGTDLKGLAIHIDFKQGTDVKESLDKIFRLTPLRSTVSFNNRVLINGTPKELSVLELLQEWVKFRVNTIKRVYSDRLAKANIKEEELAAWEIVHNDLDKLIDLLRKMTKMKEEQAKSLLMAEFGLTERQALVFLDARFRDITTDNAMKNLKKLAEIREEVEYNTMFVNSEDKIKKLIKDELDQISHKYGTDRVSRIGGEVQKIKKEKPIIDNGPVIVTITERGFIKKFRDTNSEFQYKLGLSSNDSVLLRYECNNLDAILMFTYSGNCYKIPVANLDETKGAAKDIMSRYIPDNERILYMRASNGYTGTINFVGADCKGVAVPLDKFKHRPTYVNIYPAGEEGTLWATEEKEFFLITSNRKAAYCDLRCDEIIGDYRGKFRVASLDPFRDGYIYGLQEVSKVPDMSKVDTSIYSKGYFVNIKHDLWKKKETVENVETAKENVEE